MSYTSVPVGEVLRLSREPIQLSPTERYTAIGMRSFGKGIFHYPPTPAAELSKLRYFRFPANALALSNIKAWEGAVGVTSDADTCAVASNRFLFYVPIDGRRVDVSYVRYYLLSPQGLSALGSASPGSADRNRTLSIAGFERISIPLPPIDEQRRVSRALDDALATASEAISIASGRPQTIAAGLPSLIDAVVERYATDVVRVETLASIESDTVHPGDDPGAARVFVGLEHIAAHLGIKLSSRPVGDETGRKFRFRTGDVLFGYLRPYLNKVWYADHPGLCSVEQFVLRTDDALVGRYLSYALRGQRILDRTQALTNSLQLPRLGAKMLLGLGVQMPSARALPGVVKLLDELNETAVGAWRLSQKASTLAVALQPSLLNAAFTGRF